MFWLLGGGGRVGSSACFLLQSIFCGYVCVLFFRDIFSLFLSSSSSSSSSSFLLLICQFFNSWGFLKVSVYIFLVVLHGFNGGLC